MITSLKSQVQESFNQFKQLNNNYISVVESIRGELKERFYSKSNENNFRFALSLHFGYHLKAIYHHDIQRIKFKYSNSLVNGEMLLYNSNLDRLGFVCYKKDLLQMIIFLNEHRDLWLKYCNDTRYSKSLEQFIIDCGKDTTDLIDIYIKYKTKDRRNFDDKFCFEIIEERKVKIKDIIISYTKP